jgi:hypothetical protein
VHNVIALVQFLVSFGNNTQSVLKWLDRNEQNNNFRVDHVEQKYRLMDSELTKANNTNNTHENRDGNALDDWTTYFYSTQKVLSDQLLSNY